MRGTSIWMSAAQLRGGAVRVGVTEAVDPDEAVAVGGGEPVAPTVGMV